MNHGLALAEALRNSRPLSLIPTVDHVGYTTINLPQAVCMKPRFTEVIDKKLRLWYEG